MIWLVFIQCTRANSLRAHRAIFLLQSINIADSLLPCAGTQLEWPEEAATASTDMKAWQPLAAAEKPVNAARDSGSSLACSAVLLGAGLACAAAVAVGVMFLSAPTGQ